ncbi:MAG: ATP phosphoribosyltransferase [Planctomycetota bacterium]
MTESLRIGVPSKGRLADLATELLRDAGLKFRRQDRGLFARVRPLDKGSLAGGGMPIDITFLRTDDIPVLCAEGAIDLGITGSDLVEEARVDGQPVAVDTRLPLGMGNCRLALCVPEGSPVIGTKDLGGDRVATSFPNVTRDHLTSRGVTAHIVELTGSVEVMIALGVADAIVDLVETGSTLVANKLRILEEIGSYETVLIQNRAQAAGEPNDKTRLADRIVRRIEGVVIARDYSLLEYNVPEPRLPDAESITPGYSSPTVNKLEKPGWYAVRAMVRRGEVIGIMERLEALGAEAILETGIANCRL